jgi:hypothetical protein
MGNHVLIRRSVFHHIMLDQAYYEGCAKVSLLVLTSRRPYDRYIGCWRPNGRVVEKEAI